MSIGAATEHATASHRAFAVFASLWAVALLLNTARSLPPETTLGMMALVVLGRLVAAWVLVRPSAVGRFLLLNAVLAGAIFLRLPKASNHAILLLVAAVAILLAGARLKLARPRDAIAPGELYDSFAPALRWVLIVMYFWAVVQKLNVDFFSLEVSCGPGQLANLRRVLPWFPSGLWVEYFGIYGTLVVEAGIPMLLVFRSTRCAGIALAAGFHTMLGAAYIGFSATLLAMLALFAPLAFFQAPGPLAARFPIRLHPGSRGGRIRAVLDRSLTILVGIAAVTTTVLWTLGNRVELGDTGAPLIGHDLYLGLWFVYAGALIATYAFRLLKTGWRVAGAPGALRIPHRGLALLPLLVFLNGLAPHLGLKNTQVFAMFSNLQTGGGRSNHLFIPASWQVFDSLDDLVVIRASSDVVLDKLAGPSWKTFNYFSSFVLSRPKLAYLSSPPTWQLPYFALRRRVSELAARGETGIAIDYERHGERIHHTHAERDPELSRVPYLLNKFLLLRAVPDTGRGYCMW